MLAGVLTVVALDIGIDAVMHAIGVYPLWGQPMAGTLFLLATAYRMVDGIAGSYIAARLAPRRPMQHALIIGAVGLVLSRHRCRGDLEQGASLRTSLVSDRPHRDRDAMRLGGRQTPPYPIARAAVAMSRRSAQSFLPQRSWRHGSSTTSEGIHSRKAARESGGALGIPAS